jgi:large subunit ribosomal protein L15
MKLHELRPAEGSNRKRTRVGRGIAAGGGKTAGRGTKGQKSRAGSSIPAWFEGGQTPLHIRIPKLRGFRNVNRIEYEVVNVGAIAAAIESGRLVSDTRGAKGKSAPVTVNADLLRDAGLVRDARKPLKVLGGGDLGVAVFVVTDAVTKSAREKIEGAGGTVQLLEIPTESLAALGVEAPAEAAEPAKPARGRKAAADEPEATTTAGAASAADPPATEAATAAEAEPAAAAGEPQTRAAAEAAGEPEATADAADEEEAAGSAEQDADA